QQLSQRAKLRAKFSSPRRTPRSALTSRCSFRGMQRPIQVMELVGVTNRADHADPALVDADGEHEAHLAASVHDQGWLAVYIGYLHARAWGRASPGRGQKLRDGDAPIQRASGGAARL